MRPFGWIVVVVGFAWIVVVEVQNLVNIKHGWSDEISRYDAGQSYTRDELFEAMHQTSVAISKRYHSPLWGGVLMMGGALILEVVRSKDRQ